MIRHPFYIILLVFAAACNTPFQAPQTEVEIESSSFDENTGYVHIEASAERPIAENMEIVIPLEDNNKRIGLVKNVSIEEGGWFSSDKTFFDVYIPPDIKEKILPSLEKGKTLVVRGKGGFTQLMSKSVEMNKDNYIKQLRLTRHKEQVKSMFEHTYKLIPTPRLIAAPGSSKIGGMPNLPNEIEWPVSDGRPLGFVLQLNLADFSTKAEVKEGYLFLFMDMKEKKDPAQGQEVAYRIIHYTKAGTISEYRQFPDSLTKYERVQEIALRHCPYSMLPEPGSASVRRLGFNETDQDNYTQLRTMFETLSFTELFNSNSDFGVHRFLGYPGTSTDLQLICEMDEKGIGPEDVSNRTMDKLTSDASKWRLLVQVDFDHSPLNVTELSGKYFFMIRKKDLDLMKYEEAVMYYEDFE